MSACSQNRRTDQPWLRRWSSVSRSRSMLRASFADHHAALLAGCVAWSGQPCQKQPSTKTAIRARVKTTSARRRGMPGTGRSTRKRSPRRCSSLRSRSSGTVSRRRCRDIRPDVAGDEGSRSPGTDLAAMPGTGAPAGGGASVAGNPEVGGSPPPDPRGSRIDPRLAINRSVLQLLGQAVEVRHHAQHRARS